MRSAWPQTFRKRLLANAVWQRTTPRRLRNLVRSEAARRTGAVRLGSRPVTVMLAPTSACNLGCPFCVTGQRSPARPSGTVQMADYEALVDAVAPDAYCMQLYVYGEPTLHARLPELVARAASRGLYTSTSTNATCLDRPMADALVASGLDHIVVSIDGARQETYATYRRGGRLVDALRGAAHLRDARRAGGSRRPRIEWRAVVFRHNEDELPAIRRLAARLGADRFVAVPGYVQDPAWAATAPRFRYAAYDYASQAASSCLWPYRRLVVHADGGLSPCCWAYPTPFDFGRLRDIREHGLDALWNNAAYRASRAAIAGRSAPDTDPLAPGAGPAAVCVRCRQGTPPSTWELDAARDLVRGAAADGSERH